MSGFAFGAVWLIPALPALGFLALGLSAGRWPRAVVRLVACSTLAAALLVALAIAVPILGGTLTQPAGRDGVVVNPAARSVEVTLGNWLDVGPRQGAAPDGRRFLAELVVPLGFYVDPLAAVMMLVVLGVGLLIHVYAGSYMWHEAGYWRFFAYLNLFVAMMLVLVLGSSYVLMFVGWEGVGLCSYLLIGFYHDQAFPPLAGMKAFVVNRVGDLGFLLGMLLLLLTYGSLRYTELLPRIAAASAAHPVGLATAAAAALLFVGAMGKSAQFPLHVWLPDAMAGPTPVSALIHAATMVTAGVYLVIRSNVLFQAAPAVSAAVAIVGAITAVMAATIALVQVDIKKVLAYSTVSQLGYMFIAVGVGAYAAGLFHLVTHAFFKALLFLGAGSVSHALGGELDLRKMGGLSSALPHTRRVMLVATLAIAGIPPLAGFWSKDEILIGAVTSTLPPALRWALWAAALGGAALTAFYMFRLYYLAFAGKPRWSEGTHPHESPAGMTVPLWILAGLSVFGGALGLAAWTGLPNILHGLLEPVVFHGALLAGHAHVVPLMEATLVGLAIAVAASGWALAASWYRTQGPQPAAAAARLSRLHRFLSMKWRVDEVQDVFIVRPTVDLSRLAGTFDRRVLDFLVEAVALAAALGGEVLRGMTSGRVRTYALGVFAGAVAIVAWLVLR